MLSSHEDDQQGIFSIGRIPDSTFRRSDHIARRVAVCRKPVGRAERRRRYWQKADLSSLSTGGDGGPQWQCWNHDTSVILTQD